MVIAPRRCCLGCAEMQASSGQCEIRPVGEAISGQILSGSVISLLDMTEIQLLRPEGLREPGLQPRRCGPSWRHDGVCRRPECRRSNGELVGGTDVAAQTRQVMANLATALQAAGAGIEHLVSVLVMLVEGR
jgi:hypothetical protein